MATTGEPTTDGNSVLDLLRPKATGGLVVSFAEPAGRDEVTALENAIGSGVRSVALSEAAEIKALDGEPALVFEELGVAFVSERFGLEATSSIRARLMDTECVQNVRPEFYMFAIETFADTTEATWGVRAVGATNSPQTGEGVRLAVLDTGLDLTHPDFAGRSIVKRSFVSGQDVQDGHGHGTHCVGTAAGGRATQSPLRYGLAPNAELYVGKVLNNAGSGHERDIIAGMVWAIQQGCCIISMSLGRPVQPGEEPAPEYERIGQLALRQGSLIVAAAGNESSRRYGFIAPVDAPANSPSIMAVAAVDQSLDVAEFSCGAINPDGGEVDIAGPGVGILSAVPQPELYRKMQGTSMACPHVAGVAALWAETDPALRGKNLWDKLTKTARGLDAPARDVGAGLVQAPKGQAGV
ncbi:subtilisin family serine protease [Rhodopseudomonas julia]|uniref:Subtilisin family serine protease n=1 Tax=Rhodopseudomonas julia TaxID=200617 RepID=A0ABU0C9U8_9BRAD|nr:S8 family serine peptidase [Rhodopseudomonas julia]MDQ0326709.1 subtilisin family serine protease [Rhodopseudomonas julia]